jgi:hypothetical protein
MDENYDMSVLHIYLDKTRQAFEDFKELAKDSGLIVSWKTPEQLKKHYNIDVENCKITHIRLANTATPNSPEQSIPFKPEYIKREYERSCEAKKPILIQGIERLARDSVPSTIEFLYILSDLCANSKIPVLIPMNKRFYIAEGLEKYLAEYVKKHEKISLFERITDKIRG